ncbi:MAG TPA: hypothetical protein VH021_18890 [Trebonia sp.]|nr:hypothetical protein [Trebonia sp.]
MTFCPDCGRARTTSTRYCGGCGRDYGVAADDEASPPTATIAPMAPAATLPPPTAPAPTGPSSPTRPADDRQPGGRWTWWIVAAVVVVLAAGGGAYALVHGTGGRPTAQPPAHPSTATVTHPASTEPASLQASTSPSAAASPSPSASPSASASPSVVSIAPGVRSASAPVEVVLSHYFQGINKHDYAEYASSQTVQGKQNQPQSSFDSGYATTTDSAMRLTSLTATGQGDLTATVTFTSRQSPADSVDNSPCDSWTLKLYLVPNGAGYLITPAPSNYEPSHTDC